MKIFSKEIILKVNPKLLIFLFFLILSTILWFLNALNKEYLTYISYPVKFTNIPQNKFIVNELPTKLNLKVNSFGFKILKYQLNKQIIPINIDLQNLGLLQSYKYDTTHFYLLSNSLLYSISNQISSELKILEIKPDTLYIHLSQMSKKKVPVIFDANIQFEKQYKLSGKITLMPDSIVLTGPNFILDTVFSIKTIKEQFNNVNFTVEQNSELQSIKGVITSEKTVKALIPVEKFTESQIEIPLEVINTPKDFAIKVFPRKITISYLVGFSNFNKILPSQFKIIADYKEIEELPKRFLTVHLVNQPDFVEVIKYYPMNVEYLIEK